MKHCLTYLVTFALTSLTACSTFSQMIHEQRVNEALFPHVNGYVIPKSRGQVLEAVIDQIKSDIAWHRKHSALIGANQLIAGNNKILIETNPCIRKEILNETEVKEGFKKIIQLGTSEARIPFQFSEKGSERKEDCEKPIVAEGWRSRYFLYPSASGLTQLVVREKGQTGDRIPLSEFQVIRRLVPQRATEIENQIRDSHPDLSLIVYPESPIPRETAPET